MQPIPLEPGMRVRCVDAKGALFLDNGRTYKVLWCAGDNIFVTGGKTQAGMGRYAARRFKPIVRVRMNSARRLVGSSLVSRRENIGSLELGNKFTKFWIERAPVVAAGSFLTPESTGSMPMPAPHIFAGCHG